MRFLITGGSGYFGGVLKRAMLADGHECVNVDLDLDYDKHENLISLVGDISNPITLRNIFQQYGRFDCVFHAAAQLQLTSKNRNLFYNTNINATQDLAENCIAFNTPNFVYISSNCVYGKVNNINIAEYADCKPFEEYGRTKLASEKILLENKNQLNSIIFRPPTIIGKGRLGILSLVFDFIREHKKIWLIGNGENRYQFIYSNDLVQACKQAATYNKTAIFNIGCDDVPSLNQLFNGVIQSANSQSKIYHLPRGLFLPAMKLSFKLGISPLGPYQYNMIANTYIGDTKAIKKELTWQPTKSNIAMLSDNYHYYVDHYQELVKDATLTGHRKMSKGGIIQLIKLFS